MKILKARMFLLFLLVGTLLFSIIPAAPPAYAAVEDLEHEDPVYAERYSYINVTTQVDNSNFLTWINLTSGSDEVLFLHQGTVGFFEVTDPLNKANVDLAGCIETPVNGTHSELSYRFRLGWNFTEGVVTVNATAFNVLAQINTLWSTFTFEEDVDVNAASGVPDNRVNPSGAINFNGTAYYEGTTIAPQSGNSSMVFDGVDDYINCSKGASLNLTTLSAEAWLNLRAGSGDHHEYFSKYNFRPWIDETTGVFWFGYRHSGDIWATVNTGYITTFDAWNHVVWTVSGTSLRVYINGTYQGEQTLAGALDGNTANDLIVGASFDGADNRVNGTIDDPRLYNLTLTSTQIMEHFNGIYQNETGLVLYMPFTYNAADVSGEGNHGVNMGALGDEGVYSNIEARVSLNTTIVGTVYNVNTTSGRFYFPYITVSAPYGAYYYNVSTWQIDHRSTQNQTVRIVVDTGDASLSATPTWNVPGGNISIGVQFTSWVDGFDLGWCNVDLSRNGSAHLAGVTLPVNEVYYLPLNYTYNMTALNDNQYGITGYNVSQLANATWGNSSFVAYDIWLDDVGGQYYTPDALLSIQQLVTGVWTTIISANFVDDNFDVYMLPGEVYRFIVSKDLHTYDHGSLVASSTDFKIVITIIDLSWYPDDDMKYVSWSVLRGASTPANLSAVQVSAAFNSLSDVNVTVYNSTMNLVASITYNDVTDFSYSWGSAWSNMSYYIVLSANITGWMDGFAELKGVGPQTSSGETMRFPLDMFNFGMDPTLLFGCFIAAFGLLVSSRNKMVGPIILVSMGGFFTYMGWLNIGSYALYLSAAIAVMYAIATRGGEG